MQMFRATKIETMSCEQQARFVQERLISIEEHLCELCQAMGIYARKTSKMRDANDLLASTLYETASKETLNRSTKKGMLELAENLATVGDSRDEATKELEKKVLLPLSQYKVYCRNAKLETRHIYGAKQKELFKRRQLGKVREKDPYNMKAENDVNKASIEVSHTQKALEEHVEIFEKKKLKDIKQLLLQFAESELAFHAEAVGIFTKAYKDLLKIDIDSDFEDFRQILTQQPTNYKVETLKRNSSIEKIGASRLGENLASFLKFSPKQIPKMATDLKKEIASSNSARTSAILGSNNELSYDSSSESVPTSNSNRENSPEEITIENYPVGNVITTDR
ncbi:protein FAM92A isoform X2 [Cimex lectularius]|uniref:Uncharacterized protein n=1 Tax=Cimex lectularius TaxID=79782 RepID=A0A8I6SAQ9_CIMLE|nr:protein FAM92A isoform X2 [Cimex lectularius]